MPKDMRSDLIDAVRHALKVADAMGLGETSLHLNAALVTLDGLGVAPPPSRLQSEH